jgi:hypothetical protein
LTQAAASGELLTLKLRYQPPSGGASTLLTFPLKDSGSRFNSASGDMQFATAVASFGMLLRKSTFRGESSYGAVLETASAACGQDKQGLRTEFLKLVQAAQQLSGEPVGSAPRWTPAQPAAIVGASPAAVPQVLRCGVEESSSGQFVAHLGNWFWSRPSEQVLLLGIVLGVAVAMAALLAGVRLARWQAQLASQPAIADKIAGSKLAARR